MSSKSSPCIPELYAAIFRNASIGIEIYDSKGILIDVNPACLDIFGIDNLEAVKDSRLFDDPNVSQDRKAALLRGESVHYQNTFSFEAVKKAGLYPTRKSGSIELAVTINPIKEENRLSGYIVLLSDITEQSQSARELFESERLYRYMFENHSAIMFILDPLNGSIVDANKAAERFYGWSREQLRKMSIHEINTLPHDKIEMAEVCRGKKINFEFQHRRKDGSVREVEIYCSIIEIQGKKRLYSIIHDITEKKKAQRAQLESERDLKRAQKIAQIGSWRFDLNSGKVLVSEEAARIYGVDPKDITVTKVQKIPLPQYRAQLDAEFERLIEKDYPYNIEFEIRRPSDGEIRHIHSIADYYAEQHCVIGTIQDITDRKIAEISIRESEHRFRSFVENANDIVYSLSTEGIFTYVSPNWIEYMGEPAEKAIGRSFEQVIHPEDIHRCWDFMRCSKEEKLSSVEYRVRQPLGEWRWHVSKGAPIKNEKGIVTGFVGIARDITEQKKSESALALEKERLAVTLGSIEDGVITVNTEYEVVVMNRVAEELTGWNQEEGRGQQLETVFQMFDESTRKPQNSSVKEIFESGQIVDRGLRTWLKNRDGSERLIEHSGSPMKNSLGTTIGAVLVFRDVTEKQKLMDAVQRAMRLESLGLLAGGIAHDFNNLLGGIFGYIEMAQAHCESEHLVKALHTINRARGLTRQLLTFAKGGVPIKKTECLSPFLREAVSFALSGSNLEYAFRIQPDLWNCDFDRNQLAQVIENLIINAQQAIPAGGSLEVKAENISIDKESPALGTGKYVKISIKDNGPGIPREIAGKIFDPFFTTKSQGQGLGLSTCYSIIKKHGGHIDFESNVGSGTTFSFYLPASESKPEPLLPKTLKQHKGKGTILVLDDEDNMREIMGAVLKSLGYRAICVENVKKAVNCYVRDLENDRSIVAMIFDLTIPGGTGGKAAIEEIRKIDDKIPIFVASGYAEDPILADPAKYGYTASICKPFYKAELATMLEEHLKSEG